VKDADMGGKVIKNIVTPVGVNKETYQKVVSFMSCVLHEYQFSIIESFDDKQDFGDLDVLVVEPNYQNINSQINDGLDSVINGSINSMVFDLAKVGEAGYFQIDIINTPKDELEFAKFYHGKGDIGNLIGRIAHNLGLKFGHDGLWYVYKNDTQVIEEILLSRNPIEVLNFLGFKIDNLEDFKFQGIEDVYQFVVSSPFFCSSFFQMENRNHAVRTRDSKRPNYMGFLNYIEKLDEQNKPIAGKDYFMQAIFYFGKFDLYQQALKKQAMICHRKAIIDPKFVSDFTKKTGIELGKMI
jgi:hypothetical protein